MWWNDTWGYWPLAWMALMPVGMLIFVAGCAGVVYYAGLRGRRHDRSIDILRERFARGEITQADFEERRRLLLG